MKRALLTLLLLPACVPDPKLTLDIRMPDDRHLLAGAAEFNLLAARDAQVLAQQSFAAPTGFVSLPDVPPGPRTTIVLTGVTAAGDVVGRGQTCPLDVTGQSQSAPLYFAPTNSFAPTVGAPLAERLDPIALPLDDGSVLLAGGIAMGNTLRSSERYLPGSATFTAAPAQSFVHARSGAALAAVPGLGALVAGGLDDAGHPIADAEVYDPSSDSFTAVDNQQLGARAGHRAVTLPAGDVLITGGFSDDATALSSTARVSLTSGGGASVEAGPSLVTARRDHAIVVAVEVPVVIGGFGADGAPLASLEALDGDSFATIAQLRSPRGDATATVLGDGSILVVGGAGDVSGAPRADAELYNPITRTTTIYPLGTARRGHTATLLGDGRVLIAGGLGSDGNPTASVELFAPPDGFVSERPLIEARARHVAVVLCDETVLIVGGAPDAELYTPLP